LNSPPWQGGDVALATGVVKNRYTPECSMLKWSSRLVRPSADATSSYQTRSLDDRVNRMGKNTIHPFFSMSIPEPIPSPEI